MKQLRVNGLLVAAIAVSLLVACSGNNDDVTNNTVEQGMEEPATAVTALADDAANPFYSISELELQYPHFDLISNEHYRPAFLRGMQEHLAEIAEITNQTAPPTFANTIVPLEI